MIEITLHNLVFNQFFMTLYLIFPSLVSICYRQDDMNLFRYDNDFSEDEGLSEAQRKKKKMRKRMNKPENEPSFKGKVNCTLEELQKADELWLIKLPRNFHPDRLQGHDLVLENEADNVIELNNGSVQEAKVTKEKFSLPFVCPQGGKDKVSKRVEYGLKAEKAFEARLDSGLEGHHEKFADYEEDAEAVSLSFKGQIFVGKHVKTNALPKSYPEEVELIPQPELKARHPFFGCDEAPSFIADETPLAETEVSDKKSTRKRKRNA